MTDINILVCEGLGNHFKKHWKKYALGLGAAALAGGIAYGGHKLLKPKRMTLGKKLAIGAGITAGTVGTRYLAHKYLNRNNIPSNKSNSNSKSNINNMIKQNVTPSENTNKSEKNHYTQDELKNIFKILQHSKNVENLTKTNIKGKIVGVDGVSRTITDFRQIHDNPRSRAEEIKLLKSVGIPNSEIEHHLKIMQRLRKTGDMQETFSHSGPFSDRITDAVAKKMKTESPIAGIFALHKYKNIPFKFSDSDSKLIDNLLKNKDKFITN